MLSLVDFTTKYLNCNPHKFRLVEIRRYDPLLRSSNRRDAGASGCHERRWKLSRFENTCIWGCAGQRLIVQGNCSEKVPFLDYVLLENGVGDRKEDRVSFANVKLKIRVSNPSQNSIIFSVESVTTVTVL